MFTKRELRAQMMAARARLDPNARREASAAIAASLRASSVWAAARCVALFRSTEEEVDTAIADLLGLMEPVLIAFLGITIGSIVISMYLPLFSLIGKLSGAGK